MKGKDVVIGGTYLTRIGTELARVVVVAAVTLYGRRIMTGYVVRREGEEDRLPKPRSAAALRVDLRAQGPLT